MHPALAAAVGAGTEEPAALAAATEPTRVSRAFAFVDLCEFTRFSERHGDATALGVVYRFRSLASAVASRRGVRVAKWLGDGAMFVGIEVGPVIATAVELVARSADEPLALRAGLASGDVLLLAGDDYLGRPVNLASRLSDRAGPGECLAPEDLEASVPAWVEVVARHRVRLQGLGLQRVMVLAARDGLELPPLI